MTFQKLSIAEVKERCSKFEIEFIGEYIDARTKSTFKCVCGNIWNTKPSHIFDGVGCPKCSKLAAAEKLKSSKKKVNESLNEREIELIGDYINGKTKTTFKCVCGNIWMSTPGNILKGQGCPSCAEYGFKLNKPAWIYVIDFGEFIKYGITNNIKVRLGKLKQSNGKYFVVITKMYETGSMAFNMEQRIKQELGGKFVTKDILPDGWTETLPKDNLEMLINLINETKA